MKKKYQLTYWEYLGNHPAGQDSIDPLQRDAFCAATGATDEDIWWEIPQMSEGDVLVVQGKKFKCVKLKLEEENRFGRWKSVELEEI